MSFSLFGFDINVVDDIYDIWFLTINGRSAYRFSYNDSFVQFELCFIKLITFDL